MLSINVPLTHPSYLLTCPGQWVSDEHVYHAGAAEPRMHEDHPRGLAIL